MKKTIKELLQEHIKPLIVGSIGFLAMQIYQDLLQPALPYLYGKIEIKTALTLALLSILLNIAFLVLIIISLFKEKEHKIPEPTISNGIFFDYLFNPLCPSCKAPLQVEKIPFQDKIMYRKNPKLICPNGHYNQAPTDYSGTELNYSNLRTKLIKEYFNIKDDKQ